MTDREAAVDAVRRWVEGYLTAWRSNDPADIAALFVDDAEYRTEPWLAPAIGIADITAQWLERQDEPDSYTFIYEVTGLDGPRAFVQGETRYAKGTVYSNLWVIDLADDGRASSFTEWWMDQSEAS